MQVYKCDRCGKIMEKLEAEVNLVLLTHPDDSCLTSFDRVLRDPIYMELCENCYQTIKEVLEDGEIK